ncbi:MAG TPA: hypothetical protein VGG33_10935, partial [Polyangia bacterium]
MATDTLVAWLEGETARIYDREGRLVVQLPPRADRSVGEAADDVPRGIARAQAERALLDEADLSGADRDDEVAEELLEDELPLALRREDGRGRRDADHTATEGLQPTRWQAWAAPDGDALLVGTGRSVWRVRPQQAVERLGSAPAPAHAAAVAGGWLLLAGERWHASRDGRTFRELPGPSPANIAADSNALHVFVQIADRLEVVKLGEASNGSALVAKDRLVLSPSAPVRDLAFCAGVPVALTEDGLFRKTADGAFTAVDLLGGGRGIACSAKRLVVFGPGLRELTQPSSAPVGVGAAVADNVEVATFAGERLWVVASDGRLLRESDAPGAPLVLVRAASEEPALLIPSPQPVAGVNTAPAGRRRPRLPDLLPEVAIVGHLEAKPPRKRSIGLGVVANWQLGHPPTRVPAAPSDDWLQLAGAPAAAPAPGVPAAPLGPAAPVQAMPGMGRELGPDADAGCLHNTRQRAVALAAAD